jgi:hypothetical protein
VAVVCDGVAVVCDGVGAEDEGVGVVCDGGSAEDDGVGAEDDGVGEPGDGVGVPGDGVGVPGEGVGVPGDGVGVRVAPGPGVVRVTAGEGWPLPGLLPPVVDGLLPGGRSDDLVTTTVADAWAVPICAVTWVVPGPIPVTRPEESTVATAGFPVVQAAPERICCGALLPLLSWPVNGGWVLAEVPIRSVRGLMASE